jgi:hypothetical protein
MASGALNTFRQLGFAIGVAIFGAVFQHQATGRPGTIEHALDHILIVAGLLAIGAGLLVLAVPAKRPADSAVPSAGWTAEPAPASGAKTADAPG